MVYSEVDRIRLGEYSTALKVKTNLVNNETKEFIIYPGETYLSIGVKDIAKGDIKVWLNPDDIINWDSLDVKDPFDDRYLIRSVYYTGNDKSFLEWTSKRRVEFTWQPLKDVDIDLTNSKIDTLRIITDKKVILKMGPNQEEFTYTGNPHNLIIKDWGNVSCFWINIPNEKITTTYELPDWGHFHNLKRVVINASPNGAALDCSSLLEFKDIKDLGLEGNLANLEALEEFTDLKDLGFWNVPNLDGLPPIAVFKDLTCFCAKDIGKEKGLLLRKEVNKLKKTKEFRHIYVGGLRDELWFKTEYGIPFTNWENNFGKKAMRIYKECLTAVKKSQTEEEIKTAIEAYTNQMNKLKNIETEEREDIYTALETIMENAKVEVAYDTWFSLFDNLRDF